MDNIQSHAALLLNGLEGLSLRCANQLVEKFGSLAEVVNAGPHHWGEISELNEDHIDRFKRDWDESRQKADKEQELAFQNGWALVHRHDPDFPVRLRELFCPPLLLYVRGNRQVLSCGSIAIVGSRRCTHYGERLARKLSMELSGAGFVTVSGLARGIDTHAHRGAIEGGGKTVAVIGNGLLKIYPSENESLADRICETEGAVVSEFPIHMAPLPGNFPRRNRIIAGLSLGTVVVEGTETSGALITARLAAEEGREVYAVPGPVNSSQSAAPHRLIRSGAKLVDCAEDILEDFPNEPRLKCYSSAPKLADLGAADKKFGFFLEKLGHTPILRDELRQTLELEAKDFQILATELELRGFIRSLPGGILVRS